MVLVLQLLAQQLIVNIVILLILVSNVTQVIPLLDQLQCLVLPLQSPVAEQWLLQLQLHVLNVENITIWMLQPPVLLLICKMMLLNSEFLLSCYLLAYCSNEFKIRKLFIFLYLWYSFFSFNLFVLKNEPFL